MAEREQLDLFDFSDPAVPLRWHPIDDAVMGGVSASQFWATGLGTACFTGRVSLENNGGFASVRSEPRPFALGAYTGLQLEVRGDDQQYKLCLKTTPDFDGVLYQMKFVARASEWQTIDLPFDGFEATFRGRRQPDAPPLDPNQIVTFGLMISDGQAGPFRLEVRRLAAYSR